MHLFAAVPAFQNILAAKILKQLRIISVISNVIIALTTKEIFMQFNFTEESGLTVMSLCDGNSGISHALKDHYKIRHLYRSEIDPYANANFTYNFDGKFPITDLGDLKQIDVNNLPTVDLLVCGFPCQSFSLSGLMGGIYNDHKDRGLIIFYVVEIIKKLKEKNPNLRILLENVVMKKDIMNQLSILIGNAIGLPILEPMKLNSGNVSAQNRVRLYWWNGLPFELPKLDIVFADIMERDCDEVYDLSDAHKERVLNAERGKGFFYNVDSPKIGTINALYAKNPTDGCFIEDYKLDKLNQLGIASNIKGMDCIKRVYDRNGKFPTLTTSQGGHRQPKVAIGAFRGRYNKDGTTSQQLELRTDYKTNTLTTVQKDNVSVNLEHLRWRKISVLEAERMQTMEDGATEFGVFKEHKDYDPNLHLHLQKKKLSNTQRYKICGNGFNVATIRYFMDALFNEMKQSNREVA